MSKTLYLYTTLGCHLCEQALAIVQPILTEAAFIEGEAESIKSEAGVTFKDETGVTFKDETGVTFKGETGVTFKGETGVTLELVEISEQEALVAKYGMRIPVIRLSGKDEDLGWPFDADAVRRYLMLEPST